MMDTSFSLSCDLFTSVYMFMIIMLVWNKSILMIIKEQVLSDIAEEICHG